MVHYTEEILLISGSYLLGCLTTGYYLVRWRRGEDVRNHGSGAVGARNTSRVLGPYGFAITYIGDFIKGMLPVGVAMVLGLEEWKVLLVLFSVTAGHIWPVQLKFRGGKGIATAMGGIVLFDWRIALTFLVTFAVILALTREFTLSGMSVTVLAPLVAWGWDHPKLIVSEIAALAAIVLIAHRSNIRMIYRDFLAGRASRQ
jgi:glycerol-3-phosphate acyltransferase PlsY